MYFDEYQRSLFHTLSTSTWTFNLEKCIFWYYQTNKESVCALKYILSVFHRFEGPPLSLSLCSIATNLKSSCSNRVKIFADLRDNPFTFNNFYFEAGVSNKNPLENRIIRLKCPYVYMVVSLPDILFFLHLNSFKSEIVA
jgi:hypothetical protein